MGPVGLLLTCSLNKSGIDVVVVEKRSSRSTYSKALSMNAASPALLRSLGVAERFERSRREIGNISIYWNQQRISHVDYRQLNSCYQHILAIPWPETKRCRKSISQCCHVTFRSPLSLSVWSGNRNLSFTFVTEKGGIYHITIKNEKTIIP
ncbi:FAD-dependent oxidoreductase [Xenorhabdus thuongxuanensis]|uniref:FAD-dependent oxidoreductase n=1 Tax=Xenorhabdus thuongxuanensis TaxID=1873484 RepID=UPI0009393609